MRLNRARPQARVKEPAMVEQLDHGTDLRGRLEVGVCENHVDVTGEHVP